MQAAKNRVTDTRVFQTRDENAKTRYKTPAPFFFVISSLVPGYAPFAMHGISASIHDDGQDQAETIRGL